MQRGPLISVGDGKKNDAGASHSDGSLEKRPPCGSNCCTRIFSRRLCECAPFRELDVSSTDVLQAAMLSKLRSLEGRRNRRLFCSLWSLNDEDPVGNAPDARDTWGLAKGRAIGKSLSPQYGRLAWRRHLMPVDSILRGTEVDLAQQCWNQFATLGPPLLFRVSGRLERALGPPFDWRLLLPFSGLRRTMMLEQCGGLRLSIEQWPSAEGAVDRHTKEKVQIYDGQQAEPPAEDASGDGSHSRAQGTSESPTVVTVSSDITAAAETRKSAAAASAAAVPKEAPSVRLANEDVTVQTEDDTVRRELLAAYGSRLVWLNVSLCFDGSEEPVALGKPPTKGHEGLHGEAESLAAIEVITHKRRRPGVGGDDQKSARQE